MNPIVKNIPNAITCLNMASGVTAIIFASRGNEFFGALPAWEWAFIFIAIAAAADFLDGFAARMLHAYSELGKQLDSLCDMVSFGVAPAMLLFSCIADCSLSPWLPWMAILVPVAGALRLAKFNIDTRQTSSFIGLPIPANAIFWIGFTAMVRSGVLFPASWPWFLPVLILECWLMVSEVPMFSLKLKSWGWRGNQARWILVAAAVVFVFSLGWAGLMWLIVFYILLSLLPFTKNPSL